MDPDLNKYDLSHAVARHATMSRAQWDDVHRKAWEAFYTPEHFETVMRRGEAFGLVYRRTLEGLVFFRHCVAREGVHPMDGGLLRLKHRRDRRPGLKRDPLVFYPRFWWETAAKTVAIAREFMAFDAIGKRIAANPQRFAYTDKALTPASEEDDETFDLLNRDEAARAAVRRYREVRRFAEAAPGR